jgi:hypothetical protein
MDPVLSGNHVLYTAATGDPLWDNATRVVQLYDLSTGEQTRLATSETGYVLTGAALSGDSAVWFSESRPDVLTDVPNHLYLYAIAEKNLTVLPVSAAASWPKVAGGTVIWSESTEDSIGSTLVEYNISTGTVLPVPGISSLNSAGVGFNGRYIMYTDANTSGLHLYERDTGATITVFAPVINDSSREGVFEAVLGGNFVLYRKDVIIEKPREMYSDLCLYSIPTGTTVLLSPLTGAETAIPSASDRNAAFDIRAADARQAVWAVAEGIGNERILVIDVPTMAVSSVSPEMFIDSASIDGQNMAWEGTRDLFGRGAIFLATRPADTALPASTVPARAPGFGMLAAAGGLAGAFLFGVCRRRH